MRIDPKNEILGLAVAGSRNSVRILRSQRRPPTKSGRRAASSSRLVLISKALIRLGAMLTGLWLGGGAATEVRSDVGPVAPEIVDRMPYSKLAVSSEDYLVWCFAEKPALAYVKGGSVFRSTFDGQPEEVMRAGKPLSPKSLRCDSWGRVIAVFSADGSELIIAKGNRTGRYDTGLSNHHGFLIEGQIISPDGRFLVVPARVASADRKINEPLNLTFKSGDDVLGEVKVLQMDGDHFAWNGNELIYFRRSDHSAYSYQADDGRHLLLRKIEPAVDLTRLGYCGSSVVFALVHRGPQGGMQLSAVPPPRKGRLPTTHASSVGISGAAGTCILSRVEIQGEVEVYRYDLFYGGQVAPVAVPKAVSIGDEPAIAPRGCLIRGVLYPEGGAQRGAAAQQIVSLALPGLPGCRLDQ